MLVELEVRDLVGEFTSVAAKYGCLLGELMGPRKHRQAVHARQECWFLLRDRGWTYPRIGMLFDRDHTTVMTGVWNYEQRLGRDLLRDIGRRSA